MNFLGRTDRSAAADSGRLSYDAENLRYTSAVFGSWSIAVDSIGIVGEYTNQDGPFLDDYFLIFVGKSRQEWWQASFYAEGREAFLLAFEKKFPGVNQLGLCGSTSFESRVVWPPRHHGKPLFVFSRPHRSSGPLGRVVSALDFKIECRLAEGLD
jgi:hypothetical protein